MCSRVRFIQLDRTRLILGLRQGGVLCDYCDGGVGVGGWGGWGGGWGVGGAVKTTHISHYVRSLYIILGTCTLLFYMSISQPEDAIDLNLSFILHILLLETLLLLSMVVHWEVRQTPSDNMAAIQIV